MKKKKKEFVVFKKHYIIPLIASLMIVLIGIIMTLNNQIGYGDIINRKNEYIEITGPQTITLGSIMLISILIYIKWLYKENNKND